jgi:superfamily II DNA helicase RecQ
MPEYEVGFAQEPNGIQLSPLREFTDQLAHRPVLSYSKLNADEKKLLRAEVNGICELCDQETEKLNVDHDHHTDEVRGIVCGRCNLRLGWVDGLPLDWLEKADKYLSGALSQNGSNYLLRIVQRHYREKHKSWMDELNQLDEHRQKLFQQMEKAEKRIANIIKHVPYGLELRR